MHRNAPLTPEGRLRLCNLIEDGWTGGLGRRVDADLTPDRSQVVASLSGRGDRWFGGSLEPAPKVPDQDPGPQGAPHCRAQMTPPARTGATGPEGRDACLDLPSGAPAPRGEPALRPRSQGWSSHPPDRTTHPGELVHIDVKKQARIPKGGGWRVKGVEHKNTAKSRPRIGYAFVHSAIDAYSRLAYSEIHTDERATTAIGFWQRARAFFASYGITVERVLSDNGGCYRAKDFTAELVSAGIKQRFTKPYRPQTNGKVERFNRTLQNEWAYARPYRSEAARTRALDSWLLNHHRHHTAIGGPPTSRVNNLVGQNS